MFFVIFTSSLSVHYGERHDARVLSSDALMPADAARGGSLAQPSFPSACSTVYVRMRIVEFTWPPEERETGDGRYGQGFPRGRTIEPVATRIIVAQRCERVREWTGGGRAVGT